jgi:hypothetical protein
VFAGISAVDLVSEGFVADFSDWSLQCVAEVPFSSPAVFQENVDTAGDQ